MCSAGFYLAPLIFCVFTRIKRVFLRKLATRGKFSRCQLIEQVDSEMVIIYCWRVHNHYDSDICRAAVIFGKQSLKKISWGRLSGFVCVSFQSTKQTSDQMCILCLFHVFRLAEKCRLFHGFVCYFDPNLLRESKQPINPAKAVW